MKTLRLFLFSHGIYQAELAAALRRRGLAVSDAHLSRILRGNRRPPGGFRYCVPFALAEILKTDPPAPAELFGQEED